MKSLARQHVWWPGIDAALEKKVKECNTCQATRHTPPVALLHPWEWPKQPWQRVHADYAGPFLGKMFLILVDAYSKWVDIHVVNSSTSQVTIEKMRTSFAALGLPQFLVTDNGTQFTSVEFLQFTRNNGIKHIKSSPHHPSTNGLAERMVQSFKEGMKRQRSGSIETRMARFLFAYRNTPHSTTGMSPAMLLFNRPLRSHLDLLKPDIDLTVQNRQFQQKFYHDAHSKGRQFKVGDTVFTKNFGKGEEWLPGVIDAVRGPLTYLVRLNDGRSIKRHVDHVRTRSSEHNDTTGIDDADLSFGPATDSDDPLLEPHIVTEEVATAPVRSSTRVRRPPNRFRPDSS